MHRPHPTYQSDVFSATKVEADPEINEAPMCHDHALLSAKNELLAMSSGDLSVYRLRKRQSDMKMRNNIDFAQKR